MTRTICTLFHKHLFKFNFSLLAKLGYCLYIYMIELCVHRYLQSRTKHLGHLPTFVNLYLSRNVLPPAPLSMLLICPKQWLTNMKTLYCIVFFGGGGQGGDFPIIFEDFGYFFQNSASVANGFVWDCLICQKMSRNLMSNVL